MSMKKHFEVSWMKDLVLIQHIINPTNIKEFKERLISWRDQAGFKSIYESYRIPHVNASAVLYLTAVSLSIKSFLCSSFGKAVSS